MTSSRRVPTRSVVATDCGELDGIRGMTAAAPTDHRRAGPPPPMSGVRSGAPPVVERGGCRHPWGTRTARTTGVEPRAEAVGDQVVARRWCRWSGCARWGREAHRQQRDRSTSRNARPRWPRANGRLLHATPAVPHRLLARLRLLAPPHRNGRSCDLANPSSGGSSVIDASITIATVRRAEPSDDHGSTGGDLYAIVSLTGAPNGMAVGTSVTVAIVMLASDHAASRAAGFAVARSTGSPVRRRKEPKPRRADDVVPLSRVVQRRPCPRPSEVSRPGSCWHPLLSMRLAFARRGGNPTTAPPAALHLVAEASARVQRPARPRGRVPQGCRHRHARPTGRRASSARPTSRRWSPDDESVGMPRHPA